MQIATLKVRVFLNMIWLLILLAATPMARCQDWKHKLAMELPLLGHRNWIVVVDSAYPLQTGPGIETISTGEDQVAVVQSVLDALSQTRHVRPTLYTDAELSFVPEDQAIGISAYRDQLRAVFGAHEVHCLPHEQIIGKLDEAGKMFHVLVLKTRMTLPYTSVFLQLDCGYWNAAAEGRLRALIAAEKPAIKEK